VGDPDKKYRVVFAIEEEILSLPVEKMTFY